MLAGPTAAPTLRWPEVSGVEELLAHEVRDPVEELLLRAVRWVGHATAAESPEDQGLFSDLLLGGFALSKILLGLIPAGIEVRFQVIIVNVAVPEVAVITRHRPIREVCKADGGRKGSEGSLVWVRLRINNGLDVGSR